MVPASSSCIARTSAGRHAAGVLPWGWSWRAGASSCRIRSSSCRVRAGSVCTGSQTYARALHTWSVRPRALAGVRGVRPCRRRLWGSTQLERRTRSQTVPRGRLRRQERHRGRRRRGATRPRSVPYQRSIHTVWIVSPSWRRRHGLPKRRGPPKPTRLLTSTTWPAVVRTVTTWAYNSVCGATSRGVGLRPTVPRRRRRYTPPRTWSSAAV